MLNLSRVLVAVVGLSGYFGVDATPSNGTPETLAGAIVDITVSGNAGVIPSINVPVIFGQAGTTQLGTEVLDPYLSLTSSGQLSLTFNGGIQETSDFDVSHAIEITASLDSANVLAQYFAQANSDAPAISTENPLPSGLITAEPIVSATPSSCLATATAAVNQPTAALVKGIIYIDIPKNAGFSDCSVVYNWDLEAAYGNPCPTGSACGDPQFIGFLGQNYQVHGVSGQVYNVLSTPRLQYNALFSYLEQGQCRKGTPCFSHPGNYFGQVGLLFRSSEGVVTNVQVIAGPVDAGMQVLLNGEALHTSATSLSLGDVALTFATAFDLIVDTPEFSMKLSNSDMFINQAVSINSGLMKQLQEFKQASKSADSATVEELKSKLPHGLLGQSWQSATYSNRWKHIEGTLFEYSVVDGVTGTDFKYNRF